MLKITIESRTMETFTVTNKEFGHILHSARITPKDLNVVSTAALFEREYQCFWISLGFHISCWPYKLYFEALSRLSQYFPALEAGFSLHLLENEDEIVNFSGKLSPYKDFYAGAEYFMGPFLGAKKEEIPSCCYCLADQIINALFWVHKSDNVGDNGVVDVPLMGILPFLVPEVYGYNILIIPVNEFHSGAITSIELGLMHLVLSYDATLPTKCILRCEFPYNFGHFTPLEIDDNDMDNFNRFLSSNIRSIPYHRSRTPSKLRTAVDNLETVIDIDANCPNIAAL
jgi:hypothetical protein